MFNKLFGCFAVLILSAAAYAEDTKILAFEQVVQPSAEQLYKAETASISPSAKIWTMVYVVTQANQAPDNTAMGFKLTPEGMLFKNDPAKKSDQLSFEGIRLARSKDYALSKYQDLAEMIQDQTGKKITDAQVFDASRAHVYARVEDWVPDYNAKTAGLSVVLGPLQEMEVKGLYILIGEGDKPKDLDAIAKLDPMLTSQYKSETTVAKAEGRAAFREARWMIFLVVIAMGIYLGWYRRT